MIPVELIARREQLGLSQSALATALDVKQATVSRWEGGNREIPEWMDTELTRLEYVQGALIDGFFSLADGQGGHVMLLLPVDAAELAAMNRGRPLPESFVRVAAAQARLTLAEDGVTVSIGSTSTPV